MTGARGTALVIGLCAALAGNAAWAGESPFVGRWHWNEAQSTPPPGAPSVKDAVSEISRADDGGVAWSVTIVTPDDQQHVATLEAPAPGDGATSSARVSGDALHATFDGPAGQSDTQTCTVSADGQQMTCRGVLNDGQGHTVNYLDVYDRM